jgi:hypothetical protein
MEQQLINHSPDLFRLYEEGFDLEIRGGQLIVHHVPYVTAEKKVKLGTLVCSLTLTTPTRAGKPPDHTVYFIGEMPYLANGTSMAASIVCHSTRTQIAEDLWGDHYFSSKPACGFYEDYYQKARTYAEILCAQARVIDPTVTYRPNKKETSHE